MERRFAEVHRGRAGHINIQHYAQLAAEATDKAYDTLAPAAANGPRLVEERFRFESEMHAGDLACVTGHFDNSSDGNHRVFEGAITRGQEGERCCRFIRVWGDAGQLDQESDEHLPIPGITAMYKGRSFDSFDGLLGDAQQPSHVAQALWHVMTEALWHVQGQIGSDIEKQRARGITGGANLFQLHHHKRLLTGSRVCVVTTLIGHGTGSLRFEHRISDATSGEALVTARYVLVYQQNGERFPVVDLFDADLLGSGAV